MRDSESAELGDEDVDMLEQSEPRRRSRSRCPPLCVSSATVSSSSFTATPSIPSAAPVDEGSGADSSCCRNESMSAKGSGESSSAEEGRGRKRKGG